MNGTMCLEGVLGGFFFQVYHCPKTKELIDDGCRCFPTFPFLTLPMSLSCWSPRVDSWECGSGNIFFTGKTYLRDFVLSSFLTFLLLFIASIVVLRGLCVVVTETVPVIWFMTRPYEQLLHQHNWESSEWRQEFSKPVAVKIWRGMPELF